MLLAGMGAGLAACAYVEPVALTPEQAVLDRPDPDEVISLWPGEPPGAENVTAVETVESRPAPSGMRDRFVAHVRRPTLTVFRPQRPNGAGVLIAPGGGYVRVVMDKEGYETARYLGSRGYTCFVMTYRLPGDGWAAGAKVALQDAQRAMRVARRHGGGMGVDGARFMAMGFSAGGHLIGSLCARHGERTYEPVDADDRLSARPDLGCLVYPVVALSGPLAHAGSASELLGETPTPDQVRAASIEPYITADMPPMMLFHARDDAAVPVGNSIALAEALRAAKVKTELRLFEQGGHGFGLRGIAGKDSAPWPEMLLRWMAENGL